MTVKFTKKDIDSSSVAGINEFEVTDKPLKFKQGKVTFGDRTIFMRSSWEANIASYLQFLKENGQLKEWEYEVKTFWFMKIMRGVRSYKPDFRITRNDDTQFYIEVKGYMDAKSATKLKRMKKYHPDVHIQVIDVVRYTSIKKGKNVYKGWGQLD